MKDSHCISIRKLLPVATLLMSAALSTVALCAVPSIAATPETMTWDDCQKAGSDAFYQCRYGDAERLLKQAVIKGAAFGEADTRFAKSLDSLGSLLTVRGRFVEAEPLLEEELLVKENAFGKNDLKLIPELGSLIRFYLNHGTASKADPLTDRLLEMVNGRLKEQSSGVGSTTLKKGQPLTASAATAALSVRDPLLDWAITCDDLADIYRAKDSFEYSDRLYKAALAIKSSVLGQDHLSLANSYDSLGMLCAEKNDDLNAEFYFKDSYDMTSKILGGTSAQSFSRLDKLAKCYIKENKLDKAEELYLRAQDLWKETPSKNGSEARAKYALGSLYVQEKKYAEAIPVLQDALAMAEDYYGSESASLLPFLQRYCDALYYSGQTDSIVPIKERASTIAGTGTTQ